MAGTSCRPVWVEVDLDHIGHNVRLLREALGSQTALMAVVKANGYGHGAVAVSRAALHYGASWLGVAMVEEGVTLRRAGIRAPVLVLGIPPDWQAGMVVEHDLRVALCTWDTAVALSQAAGERGVTARVHVKVDTGMGRLGVLPEEAVGFIRRLLTLPHLEVEGIFSHLAAADAEDKVYAQKQVAAFQSVLDELDRIGVFVPLRHIANTAAALEMPHARLSLVRSGIAIYGLSPSPAIDRKLQLLPAMSWKAAVSYVHRVPKNSGISYGATYKTCRETNIVTLPVGYGDGYTRLLSGRVEVLIRGKRYPVAGLICMDQCMVDVGDVDVEVGEEVVLLGTQGEETITADELAEKLGTINYEVVCMINSRVPRLYVGREAQRQGIHHKTYDTSSGRDVGGWG